MYGRAHFNCSACVIGYYSVYSITLDQNLRPPLTAACELLVMIGTQVMVFTGCLPSFLVGSIRAAAMSHRVDRVVNKTLDDEQDKYLMKGMNLMTHGRDSKLLDSTGSTRRL